MMGRVLLLMLELLLFSVPCGSSSTHLDFFDTSPLIFDSLRSLLSVWASTYAPNGHSIVPCTIAAGTNLYHIDIGESLPPSPEWLAFEYEMSSAIFAGRSDDTFLFTFRTTKPVKAIYFDGLSASAYGGMGSMDSQSLFLDHRIRRARELERKQVEEIWWVDENHRANGLCKWIFDSGLGGPGWGVEAIVRFNTAAELIWCNFSSSSLQLLSQLNVTEPYANTMEKLSDATSSSIPLHLRESFLYQKEWDYYRSSIWHAGQQGTQAASGEYRVKPHLSAFTTFYDEKSFPDLHRARSRMDQKRLNLSGDGQWLGPVDPKDRPFALKSLSSRRRFHTLESTTVTDGETINQEVRSLVSLLWPSDAPEAIVGATSQGHTYSSPEFSQIATDIVLRYGKPIRDWVRVLSRLEASLLKGRMSQGSLATLGDVAHFFIYPFIEYPSEAFTGSLMGERKGLGNNPFASDSSTYQDALDRCLASQVSLLGNSTNGNDTPKGDQILQDAILGVMNGICHVVIDVALETQATWFGRYRGNAPVPAKTVPQAESDFNTVDDLALVKSWRAKLEELVAWLGWVSEETICEPSCAWDELCYIPMWPKLYCPEWCKPANVGKSDGDMREQEVVQRVMTAKKDAKNNQGPTDERKWRGDWEEGAQAPGDDWLWRIWEPTCVRSFYFLESDRLKD